MIVPRPRRRGSDLAATGHPTSAACHMDVSSPRYPLSSRFPQHFLTYVPLPNGVFASRLFDLSLPLAHTHIPTSFVLALFFAKTVQQLSAIENCPLSIPRQRHAVERQRDVNTSMSLSPYLQSMHRQRDEDQEARRRDKSLSLSPYLQYIRRKTEFEKSFSLSPRDNLLPKSISKVCPHPQSEITAYMRTHTHSMHT